MPVDPRTAWMPPGAAIGGRTSPFADPQPPFAESRLRRPASSRRFGKTRIISKEVKG